MKKEMTKTYNPKDFEERIYEKWENSGSFSAKVDRDKKPFTIVMPPPNITGELHMGHALDQSLQDVLIRWKRMSGYSALWIPGSDHASIATEVKVVNKLREDEGKSKEEIGREDFLKKAWEWKRIYGGRITEQCRKLGNSCDWSRERFTMDEGCSHAVKKVFVDLYKKGRIYRGNRLINWCPDCGTSLSDAEVNHEDVNGQYWYFRYPGEDGGEGVVIATSRPETMFADVAIAVHTDDDRYKDMIGKRVRIPLTDRYIPVIADEYPDPAKGSGAVKITPAHDVNDFEVGMRHGLEMPVCIDEEGKMTSLSGKYESMDRFQCRKAWVKELTQEGYGVKVEEVVIPLGECYRCNTVVEPMLSDQWFVAMAELAKPALEAAKDGRLNHVPDRFTKVYVRWLEEIRDWCISRQLWWGHRIPAYYCDDCDHINVEMDVPTKCENCQSTNLRQDEDVLDTWFSSALWPFSTLGWPEETEDYKYFYPTDVLVTGYDIIFFWVVRMVFSALEITDQVPFKHVYVHGLVRDENGDKMSKSKGNGIDPLDIIEHYGADALRFMLITGITPGNDMRYMEKKVESARNFANKLWNASRFIVMNLGDTNVDSCEAPIEEDLKEEDRWILSQLNEGIKDVTRAMDRFDLNYGAQRTEDLIRDSYCDWYIEMVKGRLYGEDERDRRVALWVLAHVLREMLKLLHPFMPFITEEIWAYLGEKSDECGAHGTDNFLMNSRWPEAKEEKIYESALESTEMAMAIIKAVRGARVEAETPPSSQLNIYVVTSQENSQIIQKVESHVKKLANVGEIITLSSREQLEEDVMSSVIPSAEILIPSGQLINYEDELKRLKKEESRLEAEVQRCEKMLANKGFVEKAPPSKIEEEKKKLENYRAMWKTLGTRMAELKDKLGR